MLGWWGGAGFGGCAAVGWILGVGAVLLFCPDLPGFWDIWAVGGGRGDGSWAMERRRTLAEHYWGRIRAGLFSVAG